DEEAGAELPMLGGVGWGVLGERAPEGGGSFDNVLEAGIAELMVSCFNGFGDALTDDVMFQWHRLVCAGRTDLTVIGGYRDHTTPMQVVSGPIQKLVVHFEAPPSKLMHSEMTRFFAWFEASDLPALTKAALAHLYFVTIHPFDDGNGRIARAITDMALARSERSPQRFYSMSTQIEAERKAYYDTLERTQKGGLDVTGWMGWFLGCLHRAIDGAQDVLSAVTAKAEFWERAAKLPLNERQIKVLNRMLDGFEGKMTSSKWAKIAKCSQDSANRDIAALIGYGLLEKGLAGGRSTHYVVGAKQS
ncbi:MAG: Fic family protein, partial [Rhodobacteraceae bacterium]|nr:Fic family protein [Paracoccaceae bacterium]